MENQQLKRIFDYALENRLIVKIVFNSGRNGYIRYVCLPLKFDCAADAYVFRVLSHVGIKGDFYVKSENLCEMTPVTNRDNPYYKEIDHE